MESGRRIMLNRSGRTTPGRGGNDLHRDGDLTPPRGMVLPLLPSSETRRTTVPVWPHKCPASPALPMAHVPPGGPYPPHRAEIGPDGPSEWMPKRRQPLLQIRGCHSSRAGGQSRRRAVGAGCWSTRMHPRSPERAMAARGRSDPKPNQNMVVKYHVPAQTRSMTLCEARGGLCLLRAAASLSSGKARAHGRTHQPPVEPELLRPPDDARGAKTASARGHDASRVSAESRLFPAL
jgi:hypothetical protein